MVVCDFCGIDVDDYCPNCNISLIKSSRTKQIISFWYYNEDSGTIIHWKDGVAIIDDFDKVTNIPITYDKILSLYKSLNSFRKLTEYITNLMIYL